MQDYARTRQMRKLLLLTAAVLLLLIAGCETPTRSSPSDSRPTPTIPPLSQSARQRVQDTDQYLISVSKNIDSWATELRSVLQTPSPPASSASGPTTTQSGR